MIDPSLIFLQGDQQCCTTFLNGLLFCDGPIWGFVLQFLRFFFSLGSLIDGRCIWRRKRIMRKLITACVKYDILAGG